MTIALVSGQKASAINAGATTTQNVVLPNNPTAGNLAVVTVMASVVGTPTITCADSNSNTYTATAKTPFNGANGNSHVCVFYLQNAPANASKTITVTSSLSVAANSFCVWAIEFSGAATTGVFENDATANSGANGTAINTPSYTSTNDGDVYVACTLAGSSIANANSPWTGIDVTRNNNYAEYFIQTSAGAQAVSYTQSASSTWSGIVAAFKAAGSALPQGWSSSSPILPKRGAPVDHALAWRISFVQNPPPPNMAWVQSAELPPRRRVTDYSGLVPPVPPSKAFFLAQADGPPQRPRVRDYSATVPLPFATPFPAYGAADPPPVRRRVRDDSPGVLFTPAPGVQVSTLDWFIQSEDPVPKRFRVRDDPGSVVFIPPAPTGFTDWFLPSPEPLPRKSLIRDGGAAVLLPFPTPLLAFGGSDPSPLRRRVWDDSGEVYLPFATPFLTFGGADLSLLRRQIRDDNSNLIFVPDQAVPISGMAWYAPPDERPRRSIVVADAFAWGPQEFAVINTVSGMAWYAPPDDLPPRRSYSPKDAFGWAPIPIVVIAKKRIGVGKVFLSDKEWKRLIRLGRAIEVAAPQKVLAKATRAGDAVFNLAQAEGIVPVRGVGQLTSLLLAAARAGKLAETLRYANRAEKLAIRIWEQIQAEADEDEVEEILLWWQ